MGGGLLPVRGKRSPSQREDHHQFGGGGPDGRRDSPHQRDRNDQQPFRAGGYDLGEDRQAVAGAAGALRGARSAASQRKEDGGGDLQRQRDWGSRDTKGPAHVHGGSGDRGEGTQAGTARS